MNNSSCSLCPNACTVDKSKKAGLCSTTNDIRVAKYYLHPYEEPFISGKNGSGTIFFCGCSLKCVFCQNYPLSRNTTGKVITTNELADIFKFLEDSGAHNINFVNPTHYSNKIIEALKIYRPKVPIVYNTHGYENVSALEKLNEYVDIYLPDIKFYSPTLSKRYTNKSNYFEIASKAIEFMINSKPITFFDDKMLKTGTVVRHLVLPQAVSDSKKILDWFNGLKKGAYINIMSQYTPYGDIANFPELQRKITRREYENVIDYVIALGIENALYQEYQSADSKYIPTWDF